MMMMKASRTLVFGIVAAVAVLRATPIVAQSKEELPRATGAEANHRTLRRAIEGEAVRRATKLTNGRRDVHGFRLGMTKTDVEAAGGKCGPYWDRYSLCRAQKDGQLVLRFQQHVERKLLWLIRYKFTSGSETDQMIQSVSEQFGRRPTHIAKPESPSSRHIPAASWYLGNGISMGLYVHDGFVPRLPRDYELQLISHRLARLDNEAKEEAEEADRAKRRAINSKPMY